MPTYSQHNLILVRYPFSDLSSSKVRPAIVVNGPHISHDLMIVPLTSRMTGLLPGEFILTEWRRAGLNVPSAVKRGLYTVEAGLVIKLLGQLAHSDAQHLEATLREWLALS
ncbi:type II toxin-antitoxin system PemK/MazF family toxin [Candidatus Chloroploca sp. M-50]|uniref:MazF family transcriptional regulator n=2 Tax=Candidatus Chloroploca TaxID=1579476 RepID=A0A2H3L0X5_9CHLR|nr:MULTISPECIES: type II toxin-antitoxin system PemK/MazF family toxin [Candidatus Chloroploca]MBP1468432.1 type II toxin-antitoxin system PemK/MazF family toxin [Candidatus Chloroploca mongolica]PDV96797.1 MazF family transcriptional regulator [Candidatus Chloroploca asiatica]